MTDYGCQETSSSCRNFQSAICLHCNRRLCVSHIIEHDQNAFRDDVKKLSNSVGVIIQQVKDTSEKSRIAYDNLLPSLDEWRTQEFKKIEQIYQNKLQLIEFEENNLENFNRCLLEQLERGARLPLERMQRQESFNADILNHIRQIIDKIRKECRNSKRKCLISPSSINAEYSPSDFSLIPIEVQLPIAGPIELFKNQSVANKNPSTDVVVKLHRGRAFKRLVEMFSNVSSIQQSKAEITTYIHKPTRFLKLAMLVDSYLTAWHRTSKTLGKTVLDIYISTIKKYSSLRKSDFDILIGIQLFVFNENIPGNNYKMMTFLLEFFLKHQCITQNLILEWYNNNDAHGYMGFQEAKQLAEPFIKSLSTSGTVGGAINDMISLNNIQVVST